jgi:hypothetical protein
MMLDIAEITVLLNTSRFPTSKSLVCTAAEKELNNGRYHRMYLNSVFDSMVLSGFIQKSKGFYRISDEGREALCSANEDIRRLSVRLYANTINH